eukprot:CAMPEP_0203877324 /NCGR_PEP_ID=MMETSP0359-20131031/21935_1 /ASSEMBLY_ACC=CAM_ASM_000338 /TAXON_ID=268821 /ORGANISM="Scrippsiella Hangoei, Strain SHTV-5" /LENGTH=57 /DNA_ID=CAMNT_0050796261 /DNA_START=81 /DNA_END=251 /DNA_ORIENTATION=-
MTCHFVPEVSIGIAVDVVVVASFSQISAALPSVVVMTLVVIAVVVVGAGVVVVMGAG